MLPPAGVRSPASALSVVVLPAPFAPISVTSSRSRTSRSIPFTALMPPYATSSALTSSKCASEIRLDHCGIALHVCWGAFRDFAAVIKNGDAVAQSHHKLHVVLDQE